MMIKLKPARTCFSCKHFQSGKAECKAYTCFAGTCALHNIESTCGGTLFCDEDFFDERDLLTGELLARVSRRHAVVGISRGDSAIDLARCAVTRRDTLRA